MGVGYGFKLSPLRQLSDGTKRLRIFNTLFSSEEDNCMKAECDLIPKIQIGGKSYCCYYF